MDVKNIAIVAGVGLAAAYFLGFLGGGNGGGNGNEQTFDVNGQQIKASDMWKYGYTWLTAAQHGVQVDGWYKKQEYLNAVAQTGREGQTWVNTVSDIAGSVPSLIAQGTALFASVSSLFKGGGGGGNTSGGGSNFSNWGTGGGGGNTGGGFLDSLGGGDFIP
jgi:hypothetical protein